MRAFEIRLYDRLGSFLGSHLAQVMRRGQALYMARQLLGGVAARFTVEEI